jgi:Amt family ammonium transporter
MLVAIAFVFLMTPGLAFFEAGLLRSRNSISIMMQCWAGMCILSIMWFVFGYSLALGPDQGGVIGNFDYLFFNDVEYKCALAPPSPALVPKLVPSAYFSVQ